MRGYFKIASDFFSIQTYSLISPLSRTRKFLTPSLRDFLRRVSGTKDPHSTTHDGSSPLSFFCWFNDDDRRRVSSSLPLASGTSTLAFPLRFSQINNHHHEDCHRSRLVLGHCHRLQRPSVRHPCCWCQEGCCRRFRECPTWRCWENIVQAWAVPYNIISMTIDLEKYIISTNPPISQIPFVFVLKPAEAPTREQGIPFLRCRCPKLQPRKDLWRR